MRLSIDSFNAFKSGIEQMIFARRGFARCELQDVNNTQVNTAYFGGVVVDQADDLVFARALYNDLFCQLALHSVAIPVISLRILYRNVSTDADGLQSVKSFFALTLPACVSKQSSLVLVIAFENHVRNQLFERRIVFDQTSWPERLVRSIEQCRQITIHRAEKSGKRAEFHQERCRDNQDFFVSCHVQTMREKVGEMRGFSGALAVNGQIPRGWAGGPKRPRSTDFSLRYTL